MSERPVAGYTVPADVETLVRVATPPKAKCTVRGAEGYGASAAMIAYANPDGFLELHLRPTAADGATAELVIEAEGEGDTVRETLVLRVGTDPTAEMPAPPAPPERWRTRSGAKRLPALTPDELLTLDDGVILGRDYPPRPDRLGAPAAFNAWRRHVSAPSSFVEPELISRPDISHGRRAALAHAPQNSNNWSGYELRGPAGSYDWVSAEWNVPPVAGELNTVTYSSLWVGLDGDGSADLVQAGTEQDNTTIFIPFQGTISASTYYAWTEFLPQQPNEQQITNFSIHPGDHMLVQVFVANAGQMPSLGGLFGVMFLMNLTTSYSTRIYTPRDGTVVGGSEAEWIMERPTVSGSYPDLANYAAATISAAYARKPNGAYVAYGGANNEQITMLNGASTLSRVFPADGSTMVFLWQAFH